MELATRAGRGAGALCLVSFFGECQRSRDFLQLDGGGRRLSCALTELRILEIPHLLRTDRLLPRPADDLVVRVEPHRLVRREPRRRTSAA